ncbi:MAG: hypothetical protein AAGD22_04055 [Verrucomicrobiota bacterium]
MSHFYLPLAIRYLILIVGAAAIVGAAGWLRFSDLDRDPFHADEAATGGQALAYRLESAGSGYEFDPKHRHGPLLTALAEPWARAKGENSWELLKEETLREVVAACGLLAALGAIALGMGWFRALIAAGLAGTSPLLVYYSRIFIHEPMFLFFAIPALAGWIFILRGQRQWVGACLLGIGVGTMAATRETVVVSLFAWGIAGVIFAWRRFSGNPSHGGGRGRVRAIAAAAVADYWRPLVVSAFLALLMIFWFYTDYGERPAGFLDFFATYFEYETGEGHGKPFAYFLHLLLWPKEILGYWWTEAGVFLLALCVYLDRRKDTTAATGRFLLEAGVLHLLIFSLISYKTPWLACLGWLHLCFAGGYGGVALLRCFVGIGRLGFAVGITVIVLWQGVQAKRAVFRLYGEGRNPYSYVSTSRDVVDLASWLNRLRSVLPDTEGEPILVVGEEYWPLPWYLREAGPAGYWEAVPEGASEVPVVILMPTVFDGGSALLLETHTFIPRGLRNEYPMMVGIRNDLWEAYQAQ